MILCDWYDYLREPEVIAASISVIGVLISVLVGFYQYKQSKWNEYVSKERTIWLKEFREEYSLIMQAYYVSKHLENDKLVLKSGEAGKGINIEFECKQREEIICNGIKAKYKLISRINTNNPRNNIYNNEYKELLSSIDYISNKKFDEKRFKELTNKILEDEWKKVKREARGVKDEE